MGRAVLLSACVVVSISGCLSIQPNADDCPPWPGGHLSVIPTSFGEYADHRGHRLDQRQTWDALLYANTSMDVTVANLTPPAGWTGASEKLGNESGRLWRTRLSPETPARQEGDLTMDFRADGNRGGCTFGMGGPYKTHLQAPFPGALAQPGQGASVYTAGFWENGTLFYTNMQEIDESKWPRAGWYAWEGGDPLAVYVYDRDRTEQPAYWNACTPTAAPVASCLWSYFTTIDGFNEGLKDMSTTTARVVHIPPEKAYTLPGKESHPLYGDSLVFYIVIQDVVDVPCPVPLEPAQCDLPGM